MGRFTSQFLPGEQRSKALSFTLWIKSPHAIELLSLNLGRAATMSAMQLLLRLFDFRACLLDTAFDEFGLHFGFLSS